MLHVCLVKRMIYNIAPMTLLIGSQLPKNNLQHTVETYTRMDIRKYNTKQDHAKNLGVLHSVESKHFIILSSSALQQQVPRDTQR